MIDSKHDIAHHRAAAGKVLESVTFHKSTRLRQLLSYLCDEEFAGRSADLREHDIAVNVFGRGREFDSAEDSIVRASVRQLRAKLLEYYSGEGTEDEWQIEIPRGNYVPVFSPRTAPAPRLDLGLAHPHVQDDADGPAPRRWKWGALAAGAALIAVAAYGLGFWSANGREATGNGAVASRTGSLMEHFLANTEGPVRFVPSDSVVNLIRILTARPLTLENYETKQYFDAKQPAARANPELWDGLVTRELMNIGDASIVLRTAKQHPEHVERFSFRQARDLQMRDLKEGNFVFLGSASANPWLRVLDDSLNFRIADAESPERGRWLNRSPLPGEEASYPRVPDYASGSGTVSYAHVAVIPNQSKSGRVLLIAGIYMPGTEAAGEFVLSGGTVKSIGGALGDATLRTTPYFEALLETKRTGTTWTVSRVLVARRLGEAPIGPAIGGAGGQAVR